ncbi:MAG: hypothetical protein M3R66_16515 [Actinomycetota bacterium]|nr:hypothetical protein [Actinomycetota bacterium]
MPLAVGRLTEDPFDTAQIRQQVLDAWAASPARFREDANAEEDLVLGGYRDRLLIELAQNAADAATAAGVPGHLRLTLDGDVLCAANVGAPLDADGVRGLATLRASAKRGSESVGRYGVGFAAVLAVSDEPSVISRADGVRFSATATRAAVARIESLAGEVERRSSAARGSVPVLRLPFPVAASIDSPPQGFDTEVKLPLRPGAHDLVRSLLRDISADILLGLPGLARLDIDDRTLTRSQDGPDVLLHDGDRTQRWRVSTASGDLPVEILADRPIEEQERTQWTVSWAVPVEDGVPQPLAGRQVVHAPTPSDEPLSLPLRLIASYPLATDRRHVAPGGVTAYLTEAAAATFGELILGLAEDPALLALLPRATLAASELDAQLSAAIVAELRGLAWLPEATGDTQRAGADAPAVRIRPDRATALDPANDDLVATLADVLSGLLPASWSRRANAPVLTAIGVRRMNLAALVELLSTVDRPPQWWAALYAGLERTGSLEDRDALSAIPIPLADGRTAYGARDLLLPEHELGTADLGSLGLRLVHPGAIGTDDARRFLERVGARPATATGMLSSPAVRAAVEASYNEDNPGPIARAVLTLVQAAGVTAGMHPWLADLALPDSEGEWTPAGELVLPGSPLERVLDADALGLVDPEFVTTFGAETLVATGVLDTFAILRADSQELSEGEHDLDDENRWYGAVFDRLPPSKTPPILTGLIAVRDLDLVRPDRWEAALRLLTTMPAEVFADAVVTISGSAIPVPSYTRWWLSTHPVLDGRRPDRLRHPQAEELNGLFDVADATPDILRLVRCQSSIDEVLAEPGSALTLLVRLGQPDRTVRPDVLTDIYPRLAAALDGIDVDPPQRIRVAPDLTIDRDDAVVLDAPFLLPLLDRTPVPAAGSAAAAAVADLLDLPLATEIVTALVASTPASTTDWSAVPGAWLAARRLGIGSVSGLVATHDPLLVTGEQTVAWWPDGNTDHVDAKAGPAALGRALAWRYDRWPLRAALAEALGYPEDVDRLQAEDGVG